MRGYFALFLCAALGACSDYPRDIEGTLDRVESSKVIRIGLVSGAVSPDFRPYVTRLERATGARAAISTGHGEQLLARLEDGQIDMVFGAFAKDSPWRDDVAIVEPLGGVKVGARELRFSPVARNGENRWVMLLEHEVRDMKAAR